MPSVKKNYAKMIGGSVGKVLTVPWQITNMVVVSLEFVSYHGSLIADWKHRRQNP